MQVICYRHPTSYVWAGVPMDEAIADMQGFRRRFGFYFKELDRMQAEWERTRRPLPMRWP